MKTIHQLFRQPVRAIAGILLVSLAAAILCICAGQAFSARNAQETLDQSCTTAALQTVDYQYETYTDPSGLMYRVFAMRNPEEIEAWIQQTIREHPELVTGVYYAGLASAYIPELTPDNYTGYISYTVDRMADESYRLAPAPVGAPYSCAVLEVTLTEIGPAAEAGDGYTVELTGTVERAVSLQEGFDDPVGRIARLTLQLSSPEELEGLGLAVGGRYLVYGADYYDLEWELRGYISHRVNDDEPLDSLDPVYLRIIPEINQAGGVVARYLHASPFRTIQTVHLYQQHLLMFNAVSLTIASRGVWAGSPAIVPLDTSAEEFLASREGGLWLETMDRNAVNYHAFPMIGVDGLEYIAGFSQETARITAGRDFTQEELAQGSRVCILSAHLAEANGLTVGDMIHPEFYEMDTGSPDQGCLADGVGTVNPAAHFYTGATPLTTGEEGYVIVGLYEQDNLWGEPTPYSFTPNTIFVPKASVPIEMEYGEQAFFRTIVLKNGTVPQFRALAEEAGYDDLFLYYDQGYTVTSASLHDYQATIQQALTMGFVVYGIVLVLFLVLFPCSKKRAVDQMSTMGARRINQIGYVLLDSLGILLPGTIVGAIAGRLLWQSVVSALMEWSGAAPPLTLEGAGMSLIAAGQLVLALLVTLLLALFLTKPVDLMEKRGGKL